jgi:hypothetical protein
MADEASTQVLADLNKTLGDLNSSLGPLAQLPTSISVINGKIGDLGEALTSLKSAIGDINPNIKAAINDSAFISEVRALTNKTTDLIEETNDANTRADLEQQSRENYIQALDAQTKAMNALKADNENRLKYDKEQAEKKAKKDAEIEAKEKRAEEIEAKNEKLSKLEKKFSKGESGGYLSKLTGINAGGAGYIAAKDRITKNIDNLKIADKKPKDLGVLEKLLKATGASKYTDKALDKFGKFQQKNLERDMPEEAKQYKKLERERKKQAAIEDYEDVRPEGDLGGVAKAEFKLKKGYSKFTDKNGVDKYRGPGGKIVNEESAIDKRFKEPEIKVPKKPGDEATKVLVEGKKDINNVPVVDFPEKSKEKNTEKGEGKTKERNEVEIIGISPDVAKTLADSIASALKNILREKKDETEAGENVNAPNSKTTSAATGETVNTPTPKGTPAAVEAGAKLIAKGAANPQENTATNIVEKVVETVAVGAAAEGGTAEQGEPTIVGEKGPELFVPKTEGKVTPNSELKSMARKASSVKGTSAIQKAADGVNTTNISNKNDSSNITGSSVTENVAQSQTNVSAAPNEALNTVAGSAPVTNNISNTGPSSDILNSISQTLQEISNKLSVAATGEGSKGGGGSALMSTTAATQVYNITATGNPITNSRLKTDNIMYSRRIAN